MHPEEQRLADNDARRAHWDRWGPYLAERAWGTVREDYSGDGSAWTSFTHAQAPMRAYRWSEDGLLGWCDNHQRICFAVALWNERDPILKERLFGLTGPEGNHGEDVKEVYYYQDALPSGAYARATYRYPHAEYPYDTLVRGNAERSRQDPELELHDLGIFDGGYFDMRVEYAKASPDETLVAIAVTNHGDAATLHVLPTLWFRNTWGTGRGGVKPSMHAEGNGSGRHVVVRHPELDPIQWSVDPPAPLLFTENETNRRKLWSVDNAVGWTKEAFHEYVVHGVTSAVNPAQEGTKAAYHHVLRLERGETRVIRVALGPAHGATRLAGTEFDALMEVRRGECRSFYDRVVPADASPAERDVQRQAFAGLIWSRQFYHYDVSRWLAGDPGEPPPPAGRTSGRNADWGHLHNEDVVLMPDKWEYPWYAAWDLAFHSIAYAMVDSSFAKRQLILFLREWYMHPNGQLPAYEWAFGDVNPPVHAYSVWRVYKIDRRIHGVGDTNFLSRAFHKLLLNFTWWVNRKDARGRNVFEGGFLGLDNVGVFDRSARLPGGGHLEQSDATAWMGMFCLNMMAIALELAHTDRAYEDVASKFFEHFVYIADAMNHLGGSDSELWDESDGFYYDALRMPDGDRIPLRVRSIVGLTPLFAVETIEPEMLDRLPGFARRLMWFIRNRPALRHNIDRTKRADGAERRMLSLVPRHRLARLLSVMLDEQEFLSPFGIRSVSRAHATTPYVLNLDGVQHSVGYEPAESRTGLFGGNSNWRGPVWFPMNYLLIESLQRFDHYLGADFRVPCPALRPEPATLGQIADGLSQRLVNLFVPGPTGRRPAMGSLDRYADRPEWRENVLFHEYFNGDTGEGLGASHQTGWTALVAKLVTRRKA